MCLAQRQASTSLTCPDPVTKVILDGISLQAGPWCCKAPSPWHLITGVKLQHRVLVQLIMYTVCMSYN